MAIPFCSWVNPGSEIKNTEVGDSCPRIFNNRDKSRGHCIPREPVAETGRKGKENGEKRAPEGITKLSRKKKKKGRKSGHDEEYTRDLLETKSSFEFIFFSKRQGALNLCKQVPCERD